MAKRAENTKRVCSSCNVAKSPTREMFRVRKSGWMSRVCRQCERQQASEWRKKNPKQHAKNARAFYRRHKEKVLQSNKAYRTRRNAERKHQLQTLGPSATNMVLTVRGLLSLAKSRAVKKRVPFELTEDDVRRLARRTTCDVTGQPFVLGVGRENNRPHPLSPSLDRIVPSVGYTPDNVRLVCWWANCAKNNLSDEQFSFLVLATAKNLGHAIFQ